MVVSCDVAKEFILPSVAVHVRNAANMLGNTFGLKTIYGFRNKDGPGDTSDHPKGLAIDLMINNIPNGKSVGDQIAAYTEKQHAAFGITYIIWYRRIIDFRNKDGWINYTGTSNPHTDHVHISFASKGGIDNPDYVPVLSGDPSSGAVGKLLEVDTWIRVAMFIAGMVALIYGLLSLTGTTETVVKTIKGLA